ncbi:MAG: ChbG/HpnK family deacetylase [Methylacidiphilales bacterium]|nr:ChbG/HpnK family deacetylase [Candidatus Methylacidiphilales bacterium]
MKKRIVFVADDFGMSPEINAAIVHTHVSGALSAAALMMGQSATAEAVAMAHQHQGLQTGWHLHLNDSFPTTESQWPWGKSPARAGLSISLSSRSREIVRREIARQWELFQATGLRCDFVNSHHHLHAHPFVHSILAETLGPDFKGWIRYGRVRFFSPALRFLTSGPVVGACFHRAQKLSTWESPDTLWGLDRLFAMKAAEVRHVISQLPPGFHEFLFHPRKFSCPDTQCLLELGLLSKVDTGCAGGDFGWRQGDERGT